MIILSTSTGIYYGYFRYDKTIFLENILEIWLKSLLFDIFVLIIYRKEKIVKDIQEEDIESKDKTKTDFGSTKMSEYLLGSRKLKIFPVAMSLVGR